MKVGYYNEDCTYRLPQKRRTTAWLREVAAAEGYVLGDVNYIFCSARRLLEMNRQFLGHDYFTDVITFDYSDRRGTRTVSGDIFIDVETWPTMRGSTAPRGSSRCAVWWFTVCCIFAVRRTRPLRPTAACTPRKTSIWPFGRLATKRENPSCRRGPKSPAFRSFSPIVTHRQSPQVRPGSNTCS